MIETFNPEEDIIVETKSEVIKAKYVTRDNSRIVIKNAMKLPEMFALPSPVLYLYNNYVQCIKRLASEEEVKHWNNESDILHPSRIPMSNAEFSDMFKTIQNYQLLYSKDAKYFSAIKDLKSYDFIALLVENISYGRESKIHIVLLSTPFKIYVFDVLSLGQFKELKEILESQYPKKIVHNCRLMSDGLKHSLDITLKSVYDIQVGDLLLQERQNKRFPDTTSSLADCITKYLGLNGAILIKHPALSTLRPLSAEYIFTLVHNIGYFHVLSTIINRGLLQPFQLGCEYYLSCVRDKDNIPTDDESTLLDNTFQAMEISDSTPDANA